MQKQINKACYLHLLYFLIPLSHQTSSHYVLENVAERAQTVCERSERSSNLLRSVYELHGRAWTGRCSRTSSLLKNFWRPSRSAIRRSDNVLKTRWTYYERNCRTSILLGTRWTCYERNCRTSILLRTCYEGSKTVGDLHGL